MTVESDCADVLFINNPFQIETVHRAQTRKHLSGASNRQFLSLLTTTQKFPIWHIVYIWLMTAQDTCCLLLTV